tara:strand:+ start:479 stop:781 length:303 start_codon:yes stop_codon:yes gene_type:complete
MKQAYEIRKNIIETITNPLFLKAYKLAELVKWEMQDLLAIDVIVKEIARQVDCSEIDRDMIWAMLQDHNKNELLTNLDEIFGITVTHIDELFDKEKFPTF